MHPSFSGNVILELGDVCDSSDVRVDLALCLRLSSWLKGHVCIETFLLEAYSLEDFYKLFFFFFA